MSESKQRKCRVCECTDTDCEQCIAAQGQPCSWVQDDLCSRCAGPGNLTAAILEIRTYLENDVVARERENDGYALINEHDLGCAISTTYDALQAHKALRRKGQAIDVAAEREQLIKFDPEERQYCEKLLNEIQRLQHEVEEWKLISEFPA